MDFKRLVTQFAYKIEPKPEGGFIARATDPASPTLEAPTREELQRKIQLNILNALSTEFPSLKVPAEGKHVEMAFHVEHTPGGGFSIHPADPNAPVIQTANQQEFESRFLEKFLNFAGKHLMPELSQALAAQVGSTDVKVVVNKTTFRINSGPRGITLGTPPAPTLDSLPGAALKSPENTPDITALYGTIDNKPIIPETSNAWKVFAVFLVVLTLGALMYFFVRFH